MQHKSFPSEVQKSLGYYVYTYVDTSVTPHQIFYVGKGTGNRCFSHLQSIADDSKTRRIADIRDNLRIDILAYGLQDEATAFAIEAACIELLDNLTNKVRGHGSVERGRINTDNLIAKLAAEELTEFRDDCLLIRINQRFRVDMTATELYEATRGVWRIGENRQSAQFGLAVFDGVVQEVYKIEAWFPEGATFYGSRDVDPDGDTGRWEFVGRIADSRVRNRYRYKSVSHLLPNGAQNPIAYFGPSFTK